MQSNASTPDEYVAQLPDDRKAPMEKLRTVFNTYLPEGFEETMSSGMINYMVPFRIYPKGYHCKPPQPLLFMAIASQKNFIAVYHMGLYADENLLQWFVENYPQYTQAKLDMGKSCIRFKKIESIPYELFEILATKISVAQWIEMYERLYRKGD